MAQKINPKLFRLSNNFDWISKWSINFNNNNYIKLIFFDIFFSIYYIYLFKRKKILSNTPVIIRTNNSFIISSKIFFYKKRIFFPKFSKNYKKLKKKKKKFKIKLFKYFNARIKLYALTLYHNLSLLLSNNNIIIILNRKKHTMSFWFFTKYLGDVINFHLKRKKKFFRLIFLLKKKINFNIKKNYLKKLLGIKIKISGKINGRARARSVVISKGKLKFNTIKTNIEYNYFPIFNVHGAYGVHLWFLFSKIKDIKNSNFFFYKHKLIFKNNYIRFKYLYYYNNK